MSDKENSPTKSVTRNVIAAQGIGRSEDREQADHTL